jgi:hypothetical protein
MKAGVIRKDSLKVGKSESILLKEQSNSRQGAYASEGTEVIMTAWPMKKCKSHRTESSGKFIYGRT